MVYYYITSQKRCFLNTKSFDECKKCEAFIKGDNPRKCNKKACLFGNFCDIHMKMEKGLQLKQKYNGDYNIYATRNFATNQKIYDEIAVPERVKGQDNEKTPYVMTFLDGQQRKFKFDFRCSRSIVTFIATGEKSNVLLDWKVTGDNKVTVVLTATQAIKCGDILVRSESESMQFPCENNPRSQTILYKSKKQLESQPV